MAITFHLYKLKVVPLRQLSLIKLSKEISPKKTSSEMIKEAVLESRSKGSKKTPYWRIGNIDEIDEDGLFFDFGKITKTTAKKYNETEKIFHDEPDEQAPHTYVMINLKYQICAIAFQAKVAPKVFTIAKNLKKLLNETDIAKNIDAEFSVSEIKNPIDFIEQVRSAFSIKKFEIEFTPPNPFDVNKDFVRPMENLAEASNSKKGKTSISGENLDKTIIGELSASSASSGDNASARIQPIENGPIVTAKINDTHLKCPIDKIETKDERRKLLKKLVDLYQKIRNYGSEK